MSKSLLSLPLVAPQAEVKESPPASEWHGWTALAAPEPSGPQVPVLADTDPRVEFLAPAGGLEAAFAAFHFGADAVYLGLKKFSARAEAENFTVEELDEVTAYAHSLQPRRRVFVTLNTLIRQDELPELIETLAGVADIGVDALIIQDLGVYH